MIELGQKAKDKITGFEGILTGRCEYLYGCDQYLITPSVDKEGKRQDGEWFDDGRIEVIGAGVKPEDVQVDEPGGVHSDAPNCRY